MQYFRYDETTKEYLHEFTAQKDQVTGGYLIPCNATTINPIVNSETYDEGRVFIYNETNDNWSIVSDFRGSASYHKTGKSKKIIDYLGDVDDCYTLEEPTECGAWDGTQWVIDEDQLKEKKRAEAAEKKEALANKLTVEHLGHIFAASEKSMLRIILANDCQDFPINWLTIDDERVTMNCEEFLELLYKVRKKYIGVWLNDTD